MKQYHVWANGQSAGPYTPESLQQNGLHPETLVWTDGLPQWTPARLVPELAAKLGIAAQASPAELAAYQAPASQATSQGYWPTEQQAAYPQAGGLYSPVAAAPARPSRPVVAWISPSAMLVAFVCFFMPMVSISCKDQKVVALSGKDLAFGGSGELQGIAKMADDGSSRTESLRNAETQLSGGSGAGILAFFLTLAGIGLAFLPRQNGPAFCMVASVGAAIMLFLVKSSLERNIQEQSQGMFQVNAEVGYFVAMICYLIAAVCSVAAISAMKPKRRPISRPVPA